MAQQKRDKNSMAKIWAYGALGVILAGGAAAAGYSLGVGQQTVGDDAAEIAVVGNADLDASIRDYLLRNPEVIIEAQTALAQKQEAQAAEQARQAISLIAEDLFNDPLNPVVGNPQGDVTIVEFFDYNCGFCKRAHADQVALLSSDPEIRFVYKEFPILGPGSYDAHRIAVAVQALKPEVYAEFHDAVLNGPGQADEASAMAAATALGLDETEVRNVMNSPETQQKLGKNYQLAEQLGINGTPAYVIGDQVISGAQGVEILRAKVAEARAAQAKS